MCYVVNLILLTLINKFFCSVVQLIYYTVSNPRYTPVPKTAECPTVPNMSKRGGGGGAKRASLFRFAKGPAFKGLIVI